MRNFDWDNKTLYKGVKQNHYFYMGCLISLVGFGLWFVFGGHVVLWNIVSRILGL